MADTLVDTLNHLADLIVFLYLGFHASPEFSERLFFERLRDRGPSLSLSLDKEKKDTLRKKKNLNLPTTFTFRQGSKLRLSVPATTDVWLKVYSRVSPALSLSLSLSLDSSFVKIYRMFRKKRVSDQHAS